MSFLGGIVIFLVVMISTVNILGRWLFSFPVDGYIDWIEQFMAFFAFLGIAFTQREGGHIRMDLLVSKLKGRFLWSVELFTTFLMLFITVILIYGSYLHFLRAYTFGDTSLDIDLAVWPAKLIVPVALSLLAIRLIMQMLFFIRAIINNDSAPIGVPLPSDIMTSMKDENASYGKA